MYGLGKLADFRETQKKVIYLTPRKRNEIWLCESVTPVAKAIDLEGFLWGMVFKFVDLDGSQVTVAVNRRLINRSGVSLAKGFANLGLRINSGYELQFAAYLSAKLESVKNKETITRVPCMRRVET